MRMAAQAPHWQFQMANEARLRKLADCERKSGLFCTNAVLSHHASMNGKMNPPAKAENQPDFRNSRKSENPDFRISDFPDFQKIGHQQIQ